MTTGYLIMFSIIWLLIGIVGILIIISVIWRLYSKQRSLPCPVWMRWMLDPPYPGGITPRTRLTIERLDCQPGMQILDAGCGPGRLSLPLAKKTGPDGQVTSMDIQEGMLQIVRDRAEGEHLTNIRYIQGGLGEGHLESSRYDRAVLITVLGEIPDRISALNELFGALKPEGRLLIEETIRDPHFQTQQAVLSITTQIGFVEEKVFGNRFSYTLILKKPLIPSGDTP